MAVCSLCAVFKNAVPRFLLWPSVLDVFHLSLRGTLHPALHPEGQLAWTRPSPGSPWMSHWIPGSSWHLEDAAGGRGAGQGARSRASCLPGLSSPAVSLCTRRALAALGPGLFSLALLSGHSQPLPTARACAVACGFPAPYLLNKTFIKLCSDCPNWMCQFPGKTWWITFLHQQFISLGIVFFFFFFQFLKTFFLLLLALKKLLKLFNRS